MEFPNPKISKKKYWEIQAKVLGRKPQSATYLNDYKQKEKIWKHSENTIYYLQKAAIGLI